MSTCDRDKPLLKIDFCDFWGGFDKNNNGIVSLLKERYDVRITAKPDLIFCADYGHHHKLFACKKVFWTSESVQPNFALFDYAMTTFHIDDPRHIRLPYYAIAASFDPAPLLLKNRSVDDPALTRRDFCSFVISNANPRRTKKRIEFFELLNTYKKVSSGGTALNNIGGSIGRDVSSKQAFLRRHKFNLCFENRSFEGYVTEKLWDAFAACTVPIYWGDPRAVEEFNPKSYLSLHDHPSEAAFLQRIRELDEDDDAYLTMLREPPFHNDTPNRFMSTAQYLDFLQRIIEDKQPPLATRSLSHKLFQRWQLAKADRPEG